MQNTFCPGFTDVKHSCGTLLKSRWNQSYLTSSEGCAWFLLSQALSRGIGKQQGWAEQLGTSPKRRGDGRMGMCLIVFEVWQWHGATGRILCEREKMVLSPSSFGLKTSWFQIGPLWSKKWAGQLPGISLEDSHLPLSCGQVRERECLSLSVSISLLLLFPPPSPHGYFCLFFLWGSELALRLDPDWFKWQLNGNLTVLDWQVQQSQTDWKSLTWPTGFQKLPMASFSPSVFPVGCLFFSPTCKNRGLPIYVWITR